MRLRLGEFVDEFGVQEACEVRVHTLVARDKLIGRRETLHDAALLEPEDGAEGAAEEDTLHAGERHETRGEIGLLRLHPRDSPVCLLFDTGDGFHRLEEPVLFGGVLDICINEEGVSLSMHVLHGNLESVEAASLGPLYLVAEVHREVLIDNTVARCEECEDVGYEVAFLVREGQPILSILRKVHFLGSPERRLGLLVQIPYVLVLNGKEYKAIRILFEQGFLAFSALRQGQHGFHGHVQERCGSHGVKGFRPFAWRMRTRQTRGGHCRRCREQRGFRKDVGHDLSFEKTLTPGT